MTWVRWITEVGEEGAPMALFRCDTEDDAQAAVDQLNKTGKTNFELIQEFHRLAHPDQFPSEPELPKVNDFLLAMALIDEELAETKKAWEDADLRGLADGIGDLLYVTYRLACVAGLDADGIFREIHRSNMTKFVDGKPTYSETGKMKKGPDYSPPELERFIK